MTDLRSWVMTKIQAAVGFYFVSKSTAGGASADDTVRSLPAAPPAKTGTLRVRRMWPFGIRSRVPEGVEAITVGPMGSETQKVMIAAESATYGPGDLDDGETAIYNVVDKTDGSSICRIVLSRAGHQIHIPKNGAKVKLGSGTDADLDPIVLYTALKREFDAFVTKFNVHKHTSAGAGNPTTVPDVLASNLTTSVQSDNVVAKKK